MIVIAKAEPNLLQDVEALLKSVNLPIEEVKENFDNFFVVKKKDLIIGCAGVEIYENVGLLRSVAIEPSSQKKGIGKKLVKRLEDFVIENNIKRLYLLTESAEHFFHRLHYQKIPRDSTDSHIKESLEFTTLCPSATVMVKELDRYS
jgi:amino-acid N-acetyltransferase